MVCFGIVRGPRVLRDLNNAVLLASRLLYPILSYPILSYPNVTLLHYTILAQMLETMTETVLEQDRDLLFPIYKKQFPKQTEEASRNVVLILNIAWY